MPSGKGAVKVTKGVCWYPYPSFYPQKTADFGAGIASRDVGSRGWFWGLSMKNLFLCMAVVGQVENLKE